MIKISKADNIEFENCKVVEVLPNATFKVKLPNDALILATISGKLRQNYIRILQGDIVRVEVSPYDLTRGRITWREKIKTDNSQADTQSQSGKVKKGGTNHES